MKEAVCGINVSEIAPLKSLGEENTKLKRLVANPALDKAMLQDALRKKWRDPLRRVRS